MFRQAALDALAEESSAEAPGDNGACDAVSAEDGAIYEAPEESNEKLAEEVQNMRSQANRMEAMMRDILSLLS